MSEAEGAIHDGFQKKEHFRERKIASVKIVRQE